MKNSFIYLLKRLLKENKIKVDEKELEFQLLSHPSYPSLHSLTGVLDHFKIENLALEVPRDIESLNQLPKVFIAYIKDERIDDLVLITKTDSNVQLVFDEKRTMILSLEEFLKVWTGVIVVVEKDEMIGIETKVKTINLTKTIGFLTLVVLLTLFFSFKPTLFQSIHFLLSFIGFGISVIIVKHELGFHSKIADKFCSGNINKINCDDVLNSKAATFFGAFKLSDVGITYFIALILSWLLLEISNNTYNSLVLITIIAIPFTFYSIIYQYFIVKKWCLLCLSIVLVLWLQAGSLYFVDLNLINFSFNINSILSIAFSFLLAIALWQFVLPKLKREQELKKLKIEYYKFKRNYSVFDALISASDPIDTRINEIDEITFGNKNSLLKVVIITNPLCHFCIEVHGLVEELLNKGVEGIQIIIRFNVKQNSDSDGAKIASRLLELYNTKGEQKCLEAMHDIYGKLSTNNWLNKWGKAGSPIYLKILNIEKQWCLQNNINFTPEILVNGRSFPTEYERRDLLYFVDDIIEEEQLKTEKLTSEDGYIA